MIFKIFNILEILRNFHIWRFEDFKILKFLDLNERFLNVYILTNGNFEQIEGSQEFGSLENL